MRHTDTERYEFLTRVADDGTYHALRKEAEDEDHFDELVDRAIDGKRESPAVISSKGSV